MSDCTFDGYIDVYIKCLTSDFNLHENSVLITIVGIFLFTAVYFGICTCVRKRKSDNLELTIDSSRGCHAFFVSCAQQKMAL